MRLHKTGWVENRSPRVEFQTAEQCTIIDPETAEHIELMNSLGDRKSKLSLFGCLNKCLTRGGDTFCTKIFIKDTFFREGQWIKLINPL